MYRILPSRADSSVNPLENENENTQMTSENNQGRQERKEGKQEEAVMGLDEGSIRSGTIKLVAADGTSKFDVECKNAFMSTLVMAALDQGRSRLVFFLVVFISCAPI